jgi:hypothetical protein
MNRKPTKSLLIATLILMISALGITAAIRSTAASPSRYTGSYRPADHGLPDVIAGYRILGVITPENTACTPAGTKRVVLQVAEPTVEDFLNSSPDFVAAQHELERIDPATRWGIAIVGPRTTAEQIARGNPEWNAAFADGNCVRLGGPIILPTPTP